MNIDGKTIFALTALAVSVCSLIYCVLNFRRARRRTLQGTEALRRTLQGIEAEWLDGHYAIPAMTINGRDLSQNEVGAITAAIFRYAASFDRGEFVIDRNMSWFGSAAKALRDDFDVAAKGERQIVIAANRPD